MSAIKERFINNVPYRQDFDSYGQTRTAFQKTGDFVAPKHTPAVTWTCAENSYATKRMDRT
jgi:hypothetical protein